MPYSEQERKNILVNAGYDPEKYDYNEGDSGVYVKGMTGETEAPNIIARPPALEQQPVVTPPKSSIMGAFGKNALEAVGPTAIGLGLGVGLPAAATALAPETGGLSLAALGLAGSAGGGLLSSGLQRKYLLSEEFKKSLAQSQQEHPIASAAGSLAPAAALFNPILGFKNLPKLFSALKKLPTSGLKSLTAAEANVAKQAALNAGVSGGVNAGQQLASDDPFSVGELSKAILPALVMNEPNFIGRKLGFHSTKDIENILATKYNAMQDRLASAGATEVANDPIVKGGDIFTESNLRPSLSSETGVLQKRTAEDSARAIQEQTNPEQKDFLLAKEELRNQELKKAIELRKQNEELQTQLGNTGTPVSQNTLRITKPAIEAGIEQRQVEVKKTPEETQADNTLRQQAQNESNAKPLTEAELIQEHADQHPEQYSSGKEGEPLLLKDLSPSVREALVKMQTEDASRRGVGVEQTPVIKAGTTGEEVAGKINNPRREATVSENKGGVGTIPHEAGGHRFVNDLEVSSDSADQKLFKRLMDIFKSSPDPKEAAAVAFEKSDYGRSQVDLYGTKLQKFKQWAGDVNSHIKTKFGFANDNDVIQYVNARYKHQAPFGTRIEDIPAMEQAGTTVTKPSAIQTSTKPEASSQELKDAPVIYGHFQPGFDLPPNDRYPQGLKQEGKHVYHVTDDVHPEIARGSTVYEKYLKERGYKIPEAEKAKEKDNEPKTVGYNEAGDEQLSKEGSVKKEPTSREEKPDHTLPLFRTPIDKIKRDLGTEGKTLGKSFEDTYNGISRNHGQYVEDLVRPLSQEMGINSTLKGWITQSNPMAERVTKYLDDIQNTGSSSIKLNPNEQKVVDRIRAYNEQVRKDAQARPALAREGFDPTYFQQTVNPRVIDTVLNKPQTAEARKLVNDFIQHQIDKGDTKPEAIAKLQTYKQAFAKNDTNLASQFGPIDRAAGIGIPSSWIEPNLLLRMARYGERVGRRFAYHDNIETKPEVIAALQEHGGNADVKTVHNNIIGLRPQSESTRNAVGGLVRAGMMQTLTGEKDFTTNLSLGFQHQNLGQSLQSPIQSWKNFRQNWAEGFSMGINRTHIGSLEMGDDIGQIARRLRDVTNEATGRNVLEKAARTTAYGQGKWLAIDNFGAALRGRLSKQGESFLENFVGKDWKKYLVAKQLPVDVIKEAGAKFTESVQGTYDYRGLPKIAMEGSLAPVLSLARWNIEKTNNFMKYVVNPAMKGNYRPLLMQTLGMLIGGAATSAIVEATTGRKDKTPSFGELATASKHGQNIAPGLAYKMMGLVSLSGYAGMLGDLAKAYMDKEFHNQPQVMGNVLLEGIGNFANRGYQLVDAIEEGNPEVTTDILLKMVEDNVQVYRLVLNHPAAYEAVAPDKAKHQAKDLDIAGKMRDYKTFKNLYGYPVSDSAPSGANPFTQQDTRTFKRTDDMKEAAELASKLVKRAIEDSKRGGTVDSEALTKKLKGLRGNNYQTMPEPENNPQEFVKYRSFLEGSQGEGEALNRVRDYFRQRAINEAKTSMIPAP